VTGIDPHEYCRDVEAYLCRKNDGHLIRVTGPSFDLVSGWAERGIPLRIAYKGIDVYFERYYRNGPRRRPVRIDFCEADVLDAFDEWRRAVGIASTRAASDTVGDDDGAREADASGVSASSGDARRRGPSLPAHLERVLLRLSSARATGRLGPETDAVIDEVAAELDAVRASAKGTRGPRRQATLDRLSALDARLLAAVQPALDQVTAADVAREADEQLAGFRTRMTPDAFARAREAAVARLVRERLGVPTIAFT
jgi:hypothetical protein